MNASGGAWANHQTVPRERNNAERIVIYVQSHTLRRAVEASR